MTLNQTLWMFSVPCSLPFPWEGAAVLLEPCYVVHNTPSKIWHLSYPALKSAHFSCAPELCKYVFLGPREYCTQRHHILGGLKTLAKLAAAGEDGMSISPLRNLDRKGGAYVIMLQQFRRALGVTVTVVRGMAKHKLSRVSILRKRNCRGG